MLVKQRRVARRRAVSVGSVALFIALLGAAPTIAKDTLLAYAECMRDNGIEVTDPVFDEDGEMVGGLEFDGGTEATGGDFEAASEACKRSFETIDPAKKEERAKADRCNNAAHPDHRRLVQGDESRDYLLYVPETFSADTPAPLIINFHGFGGCATDFADLVGESYGLHEAADEAGFLVAYPQGLERTKGGAEWDPGDDGSDDIVRSDLALTEQLVWDIREEHPIDSSRVYATGFSNGGMMAYGLACSRSELIAAVGIMSGVMLPDDCAEGRPTSVIHFHGTDDGVLPLEGNRDFQSVASIVDFWLEQNHIPPENRSADVLKGGDVLRERYARGAEDTAVALYTVRSEYGKGGGHVWFSEEIESQTPNEILWDFLSDHHREE